MQRVHRYLGSLLLGAALVAPLAVTAISSPEDRKEDKREEKERERRYYDRDHKDYHTWNDREDGSFRRWMDERRDQSHRGFAQLKHKEQSEYWKWRHEHPDNDGDRH